MLWLRLSKYNDSCVDFVHKLCPFAKAAANAATALQPPRLLQCKRPGWQYQPLYSWLVVL